MVCITWHSWIFRYLACIGKVVKEGVVRSEHGVVGGAFWERVARMVGAGTDAALGVEFGGLAVWRQLRGVRSRTLNLLIYSYAPSGNLLSSTRFNSVLLRTNCGSVALDSPPRATLRPRWAPIDEACASRARRLGMAVVPAPRPRPRHRLLHRPPRAAFASPLASRSNRSLKPPPRSGHRARPR